MTDDEMLAKVKVLNTVFGGEVIINKDVVTLGLEEEQTSNSTKH